MIDKSRGRENEPSKKRRKVERDTAFLGDLEMGFAGKEMIGKKENFPKLKQSNIVEMIKSMKPPKSMKKLVKSPLLAIEWEVKLPIEWNGRWGGSLSPVLENKTTCSPDILRKFVKKRKLEATFETENYVSSLEYTGTPSKKIRIKSKEYVPLMKCKNKFSDENAETVCEYNQKVADDFEEPSVKNSHEKKENREGGENFVEEKVRKQAQIDKYFTLLKKNYLFWGVIKQVNNYLASHNWVWISKVVQKVP